MDELIGKVVQELYVTSDDSILLFATADGDVAYETEAEVSSETWFADIIGVASLLGYTVTAVQETQVPETDDDRDRQLAGYDKFYGITLTTDAGYVDIIFRNSSNGYYEGDIHLYTGPRPDDLVPIITDWQA